MKSYIIYFLCLFLITGCATNYQPEGLSGGYKDIKLQKSVYRISFKGNADTSDQRVKDFALLRASEVTLENNFKYFIIISASDASKSMLYTTPINSYSSGTVNTYGNSTYYNSSTSVYGGQAYIIKEPFYSIVIQCFTNKPNTKSLVYDAKELEISLKKAYKIK